MGKEIKSKRYSGVYYREVDGGKDRSYFLRFRLNGEIKRITLGRKSEGITESWANQERIRILNSARFGEDVAAQLQKVKPTEPTFGDLFEWYISKRELKASTVEHLQILRKVPFWNSRKVTRDNVQAYIDELAKTKRPATVTLRYRQLRAVFRYAVQREKYKYPDPSVGIDLPRGTGPRKRYLDADEVQTLLDALKDKPRHYLFVKIMLCTGARLGTVISIHSDNIKPDGTVELYNHKAGRWYTGFLDDETMRLLAGKKGYVLALKGKENKVPSQQSLQYPVLAIMNDLFNTKNTPREERACIHSLRHSCAVRLLENGVPLEVVSKVLDHQNITTTANVYAKVSKTLIKQSVKNLWG